jgi:tRNA-specific adenosine deaminase 1
MELCMAAQEDSTPWAANARLDIEGDISSESEALSSNPNLLDGRAHFSILGVVRRKPGRADAESTLSKSCSDKLALRQVVSLLSYPSSILVSPTENAYLAGLVLPEDEISRVACDRAFGAGKSGRMKSLTGRFWSGKETSSRKHGYRYRPFEVIPLPLKEVEALWSFGKPKDAAISAKSRQKIKTGNISAVWIAAPSSRESVEMPSRNGTFESQVQVPLPTSVLEAVVNGVKQGNRATFVTSRGASVLSRAKMWSSLQDIVHLLSDDFPATTHNEKWKPNNMGCSPVDSLRWVLQASSYKDFKRASVMSLAWIRLREQAMREAKYALQPWIHNRGDEDWNIETLSITPNQQKQVNK